MESYPTAVSTCKDHFLLLTLPPPCAVAMSSAIFNCGSLYDKKWRLTALFLGAVRVNETDTFADEDGANDEYFDFEDISGKTLAALHSDIWRC